MTTSNATAAVPAETDPSAEASPPAKRKGALPTVSGSGPGEWNNALLAGIVQVCAGRESRRQGRNREGPRRHRRHERDRSG